MSTTTDKLALFKYDPSTDGAQTFNIKQALNDNWDKLDDAVKEILITLANKENAGAAAAVLKNLNTHTSNDNIHVTAEEKVKWNNPGAVLYTPQNLTGEQKVQALQNISAAPGWYGLGGGAHFLTAADNLDNFPQAGWYGWHESVPQNGLFPFCSCLVLNCGNEYVTHQILYTADGSELRRMYNGGTGGWKPFEWVNPPLYQGGEYRTTERYLGKPVYKQLMHLGALGSDSVKTFYPFGENYVAGDYNVFSAEFHLSNFESGGGWTMTLPYVDRTTQQTIVRAQWVGVRVEFYISTNELATYHGFVLLKYTKATD